MKDELKAREDAMAKVRAWWDAGLLAGEHRDVTKSPSWPEYLDAFAAYAAVISDQGDA